ncbi:hypothetical protein [Staphylococcus kloosii]|nr:hypothetical protein [Staphylococcus kloosii]
MRALASSQGSFLAPMVADLHPANNRGTQVNNTCVSITNLINEEVTL